MHLAGRMGHERYGSSGNLPTHRTQQIRRRQALPSTTRTLRYCAIIVIAFITIGFIQHQKVSSTVSRYLPSPGAGPIAVLDDSADQQSNGDDEQREPTVVEDPQPGHSLPQGASPNGPYPKFGKLTASFGEPDPPYENAIASHNLHNELHGYPHFILREHMIRGLWSKHGWIMTIIGQELAKPEDQRLKWLMWHDRDTVLMNPQISLDIFVPPEPAFSHIHLLVTNDRHGLNNGVFMIRVSQWGLKLLASALSIREYQPEIPLKYTEQSGMEEAIKRPWWSTSVAYVPQRWFNGFPPDDDIARDHKPVHSREGSLLIHFASNRDGLRPERMAKWGEIAKNRTAAWDKPVEETNYLQEIAEYWDRMGKGEPVEKINQDIGRRPWKVEGEKKAKKEKKESKKTRKAATGN